MYISYSNIDLLKLNQGWYSIYICIRIKLYITYMYICIIYVYKFRLIACLRGTFLLKAASVGRGNLYNVTTM